MVRNKEHTLGGKNRELLVAAKVGTALSTPVAKF
jgi:hypothetical protein